MFMIKRVPVGKKSITASTIGWLHCLNAHGDMSSRHWFELHIPSDTVGRIWMLSNGGHHHVPHGRIVTQCQELAHAVIVGYIAPISERSMKRDSHHDCPFV
jgi:hypothetical protein